MNKYGIDLEKIETRLNELLTSGKKVEVVQFAQEAIPLLIEDSRKTRMEVVRSILNQNQCHKDGGFNQHKVCTAWESLKNQIDLLMKDLLRRIDEAGISTTEWEEGYTSDDVDVVLDFLQQWLPVNAEIAMVWDHVDKDGGFPTGDSEMWIFSTQPEGLCGAPITTPFITEDALNGFLFDIIAFNYGALSLKPVRFKRFSNFNLIRTQ